MTHLQIITEGFGYIASLIILVSLLTTNVFRLRLINAIGSVGLAVYGGLIGSWPVCAINVVIAAIDLWYLIQALSVSAFFDLEPASCIGDAYFRRFFLYHEKDLRRFTPGLTFEELLETKRFILFRNLLPVGLFAYRQENDEARIVVDFMIPEYRDFKAGRFLYAIQRLYFKEQGIKHFAAVADQPSQIKYLLKNGFTRESPDDTRYLLEL